jgi:Tol biopolymer transport system component
MRPRIRLLALPALLIALLAGGATGARAAAQPADATLILSGDASLLAPLPAPVGDSFSGRQAVSAIGTRVAFTSSSDGLGDADDDTVDNVYVRDTTTETVTLVSRRSDGTPAHQDCHDAAISGDGTRVAFVCDGPLDDADTNGRPDVYVRDLGTNETFLVSRASDANGVAGAAGDAPSREPAIDQHGTHVAFTTRATNLIAPATPPAGVQEVYVRKLPTGGVANGTTALVSRADATLGDAPASTDATNPSISGDGDEVAFLDGGVLGKGEAPALTPLQVFVRTISASQTLLASVSITGKPANGDVDDAMISADGRAIAFSSSASDLDPIQTERTRGVFLRTLAPNPATILVSRRVGGPPAEASSVSHEVSIDVTGSVVAFQSSTTTLDPADAGASSDVYVYDARGATPVLRLASRPTGSGPAANLDAGAPSVSGDGRSVLVQTFGSLVGDAIHGLNTLALRDLDADTTIGVARPGSGSFDNAGGAAFDASITPDGRFVALETTAPALGVSPAGQDAIVVRDTVTGAVQLASRLDGPDGAPITDFVSQPSISADGRRVAFVAPLPSPSQSGLEQVWVRDLAAGTTTLVSRADGPGGVASNGFAATPSISADGNRVAFRSNADNLTHDGPGASSDAFVRDLAHGTTTLVSRAGGAAGAKAGGVSAVALSADGEHVAFATTTSLDPADQDQLPDVYVRDLHDPAAPATRLADVAPDGTKADRGTGGGLSISADGRRVAFRSLATNLGTPIPAGLQQVWVHDLADGSTALASRADGAGGAPAAGGATELQLSADGRFVAFGSTANDLVAGVAGGLAHAYRRDLAAGTTRLVSRGPGANGAPTSAFGASPFAITGDGGCVVFSANEAVVAPAPGLSESSQMYLRTFEPDCGRPQGVPQPGPPPLPRDTTPPRLSRASLTHKRFRVAKAATAVTARAKRKAPPPRGTVLALTSSEAGRLTLLIERARPGHVVRKRGKRVCAAVRKPVKRGACTLYARAATLTRTLRAGRARISLSGRVGKRALAPGTYRLTLTERDAAGNVSKAVRLTFAILRG